MMAHATLVYEVEYVAMLIGENLELLKEIVRNLDNFDDCEVFHVHDGTGEDITTFTQRGIVSLQEFLADVRNREGGIRRFLEDSECDPEVIERIMADEPRS